jgi:hypothetical protein
VLVRYVKKYFNKTIFFKTGMWHLLTDRDSSVGISTRYGLDGPGIESPRGARRSAPVQTDHLYNGYRVFPWGKAAGEWL